MANLTSTSKNFTLRSLQAALEANEGLPQVPSRGTLKLWSASGAFANCTTLQQAVEVALERIGKNAALYSTKRIPSTHSQPAPRPQTNKAAEGMAETLLQMQADMQAMKQQMAALLAQSTSSSANPASATSKPLEDSQKVYLAIEQLDAVRKLMLRQQDQISTHGTPMRPAETSTHKKSDEITALDVHRIFAALGRIESLIRQEGT